jgi:hypothetical protein
MGLLLGRSLEGVHDLESSVSQPEPRFDVADGIARRAS